MVWVIAQMILFVLIIFLPLESQVSIPSWLQITSQITSFIGFALLCRAIYDLRKSLAIQPVPNKDGQLQTRGIYSFLRHPMYLSVWLILGGGILRSGSYVKFLLFAVLVVFFVLKIKYEEHLLKQKYSSYEKYMSEVGAFFPKL